MTPATPLPLADILLPPAIGWWPPAPGWWLLLILTLLLGGTLTVWLWRRWQQRRWWQQRIRQLQQRTAGLSDAPLYAAVNQWLKEQLLGRDDTPLNRHGDAWIAQLNACAGQPLFTGDCAAALAHGLYQPQPPACSRDLLCQTAARWLQATTQRRRKAA